MKKSICFLLFLLAGLTHEVAGQEIAGDRLGRWHWQVNSAVQLAGRGEVLYDEKLYPSDLSRNERYGLGFAAWRDLHPNWSVGLGLNYHIHQLRYNVFSIAGLGALFPQQPNLRHSIGATPAIRWQKAVDRGVFLDLTSSLRLALGDLGKVSYDVEGQLDPDFLREFVYEPRFSFGQSLGLGYLFPISNGGAISLRASALCELRHKQAPTDFNYPEKPWRVQPGLELGWRWGR